MLWAFVRPCSLRSPSAIWAKGGNLETTETAFLVSNSFWLLVVRPGAQEPLVASLLLVVGPGAPSSFLLLVAKTGAPSSVPVPSRDALCS